MHLLDQHSLILRLSLRCYCKLSVGCIQNGHTYLLNLKARGRSYQGCPFCDCICHNQSIDWLQNKYLKVFLFILVTVCFSSGKRNTESSVLTYYHHCHQTKGRFLDILLSRFSHQRHMFNRGNIKFL